MAEEQDALTRQLAAQEQWAMPDHNWDADLDMVPEPTTPPVGVAPERERNPDGTFAAAKPVKNEHSPWLSRQALDLGITQDEIDSTPTDSLGQTVFHLAKRERDRHDQERWLAPAQPAATPAPEPEDELSDLGELKDQLDPRLANFLRRVVKENKELRSQVGQVQGEFARRSNESTSDAIDRAFQEHGDPERLGKGTHREATEAEMRRRRGVWAMAQQWAGQGATTDQVLKQIPEVLKDLKLTKPAAPDTPITPAARTITRDEWEGGGLLRPTQRNGSQEPKGPRRAEKAVNSLLRDRGISLEEGVEESGLPE